MWHEDKKRAMEWQVITNFSDDLPPHNFNRSNFNLTSPNHEPSKDYNNPFSNFSHSQLIPIRHTRLGPHYLSIQD